MEYSQDISLEDYLEDEQFEVLQSWIVEVVAEIEIENDVYTIGRYGYFPGRITREDALQSIKKEAENMEGPEGKDVEVGEIEYDQMHLKRTEIWLPYIGAWRSKRILNRMEKAGLVEKNGWYPFFMLLIPR